MPLLQRRRAARVLPVLVACCCSRRGRALVTALEMPHYLVPSPLPDGRRRWCTDWALLVGALLVTLKITVLAFAAAPSCSAC